MNTGGNDEIDNLHSEGHQEFGVQAKDHRGCIRTACSL